MTKTHDDTPDERRTSGRDERCAAPHPLRSFIFALPAFAIVLAAVLLLRLFA
jgi:hypothetical protein